MITYRNINVTIDTGLAKEVIYLLESGYHRSGLGAEERVGLLNIAAQIKTKLYVLE